MSSIFSLFLIPGNLLGMQCFHVRGFGVEGWVIGNFDYHFLLFSLNNNYSLGFKHILIEIFESMSILISRINSISCLDGRILGPH
jgi:hypothetical protein